MWASVVAQTVKNMPTMQETQVSSLGPEDPLEKGVATHSPCPPQYPSRYSCLGNPMDREIWQATVHGVTKESYMT